VCLAQVIDGVAAVAAGVQQPAVTVPRAGEFVPTSQVLFGSDFPYIGPAVLQAEKYALENSKVWDEGAKAAIDRENALALFPRFA
jgi:predicted TIM-barrel fold metal-dependent hydrolase